MFCEQFVRNIYRRIKDNNRLRYNLHCAGNMLKQDLQKTPRCRKNLKKLNCD